MRWDSEITLVAKSYEPDSEGVPQPTVVETTVFCNEYSIGAATWSSMYEIGISVDAEVQVHSFEYDGQRDAFYKGTWYSVEVVKREGDYTRLMLRHQKSDTDDSAQKPAPQEQAESGGSDG